MYTFDYKLPITYEALRKNDVKRMPLMVTKY